MLSWVICWREMLLSIHKHSIYGAYGSMFLKSFQARGHSLRRPSIRAVLRNACCNNWGMWHQEPTLWDLGEDNVWSREIPGNNQRGISKEDMKSKYFLGVGVYRYFSGGDYLSLMCFQLICWTSFIVTWCYPILVYVSSLANLDNPMP